MRRRTGTRQARPDLLVPTTLAPDAEDRWAGRLIDPVAQVSALADLVDRGLVSAEEFERQRLKIFEA